MELAPAPWSGSQCRLLVGPAAIGAQALLAVLALSSLLYKRHVERPQRPLHIWGLDVSKQAASMLAAHICGMLIALIAHLSVRGGASSECAWYFVAFTFDTTIGLLLTIGLHRAALWGARWYGESYGHLLQQRQYEEAGLAALPGAGLSGAVPGHEAEPWYQALLLCGNYGEPPSYRRWGLQLGEWVACVVLARALCGALVVALGAALVHVAQVIDGLFEEHPTRELYFVMICCPLLMNIAQVLIQDLVLKWRRKGGGQPGSGGGGGGGGLGGETGMAKLGGERHATLLGPGALRSAGLT